MNLANQLTKRNNFTKSITLELKPTEATSKALKKDNVLEYDTYLQKKADIVTQALDIFYREFLKRAESKIDINWDEVSNSLLEGNDDIEDTVVNKIIEDVNNYYNSLYDKKFDASFISKIFTEWVTLHTDMVPNHEDVLQAISDVKGASPIFKHYFTSRKMILESTGKNSYANRVWTNFVRYNSNISLIKKVMDEQNQIIQSVNDSLNITAELYSEPSTYANILTQDGIDLYNNIIVGLTDGVNYIKGINQLLSELNQANKDMDGFRSYKMIDTLDKQILAEGTSQYKVDSFTTDEECFNAINDSAFTFYSLSENISTLISSLETFKLEKIGLSAKTISFISIKFFDAPNLIKSVIVDTLKNNLLEESGKKKLSESDLRSIEKSYKNKSFSVAYLDEIIRTLSNLESTPNYPSVEVFFEDYIRGNFKALAKTYANFSIDKNTPLSNQVSDIKKLLDAMKDVNNVLRYFKPNRDFDDFDVDFYSMYDEYTKLDRDFNTLYNKVRAYATKTPASLAHKNATCFGSASQFSNGWTQTEPNVFSKGEQTFLYKDGKYYYAMFSKAADTKLSKVKVLNEKPDSDCYSKPVIETLAKAYMNLPKYAFTVGKEKSIKGQFADKSITTACRDDNMLKPMFVERDFYEKYLNGWHKKSHIIAKKNTPAEITEKTTKEYKEYLIKLIDFFKEFLTLYIPSSIFDYDFLPSDKYSDIGDFFNHVDSFWYKISEGYILSSEIDKLVNDGMLYLFEVTSTEIRRQTFKDSYSLYFKSLLSEENRVNTSIKLNGAPQFFFRPAVIDKDKRIIHKKGTTLVNRTASTGERIPEDIYLRIYRVLNGKLDKENLSIEEKIWLKKAVTKTAKYDIIKDRNYTEDKYGITFSININTDVWQRPVSSKDIVLDHIRANGTNILSVVRGEENLLYYVLMDTDGNILMQKSLNVINGVDYHSKLKAMTYDRRLAQKNWDNSKKVEAFKEGYLKFAISEIIKLALDNNALIVIENINDSFMDKRSLVDNQVYKKFETTILKRLANYSNIKSEPTSKGGLINPYQLANPDYNGIFNSLLMNIETSYTSNMCPVTRFVNLFNYKNVNSTNEIRAFFERFKSITFNPDTKFFEFEFDYNDFATKRAINKSTWVITSAGNRTMWNAQDKKYEDINPTEEIKDIFNGFFSENLVDSVNKIAPKKINRLFEIFKLLCSFKVYTENGSYIISSVKTDKPGLAYDSRDVVSNELPNCADANKAYRVGQKAVITINKALNNEPLGITAEEWINL